MAWLSDWLKSIIMVILLAAFVDILLPSQTMQRYVKTVISLFILLTLLQPVFSLLQKEASVSQLLADADALLQRAAAPDSAVAIPAFSSSPSPNAAGTGQQAMQQGASAGMQSLDNIQRQAEQLKAAQEKRSEQLLRQQITTLMKQNVEQELPFSVQSLNVETGKDTSGQMQILAIHLQATQRSEGMSSKQGEQKIKAIQVEPVQPVKITIQADSERGNGALNATERGRANAKTTATERAIETANASGPGSGASNSGSTFQQEKSQIQSLISKVWQVPKELIFVEVSKM
jgi:stage III sporulation protein AF